MERTATGFILLQDKRRYEVKAIAQQNTQLKVTLKATRATSDTPFELATIDLYSHRSRQWFAQLCAKRSDRSEVDVETDLQLVLEHAERYVGTARTLQPQAIELSDSDEQDAIALLKSPDMMERITADMQSVGYVGEPINKQLAYLVATSRKLERPLSLLIESRSGAGKSALQDAVLALMPDEECLKYSRITDQALFYKQDGGLEGKLLVIEEATGMGGAVYSIRALLSSDTLKVAATGKDPLTGKMKTEEYTVKVRTAVMMTTTRPNFDEETKSRFLCASVNETKEATTQILAAQRQADTLEGIAHKRRAERICSLHQNAQRMIAPIAVANPCAPKLSFPAQTLSARRDNQKYLTLIKTVALLHQHQRPKKRATLHGESFDYIDVTLSDIAIANHIAQAVLVAHQDVTPQARRLFRLIRKMMVNGAGHKPEQWGFSRRTLREFTGWSDWQLRTHLSELVELEYLHVRQGHFGKEYVYELDDTGLLASLPGFGLTDADALHSILAPDNLEVQRATLDGIGANLETKASHLEKPCGDSLADQSLDILGEVAPP